MPTPIISSSLFTDANLKYYWTLDGNSNAKTGSQNGTDSNITYESSSQSGFGQDAIFNSTADRITFGTVFTPRAISGTISAWVKPAVGINGDAEYKFTSWWGKGDVYFRIGIRANNIPRLYYYDGNLRIVNANTTVTTGSWNHVAVRWNATSSSIFINGQYASGSSLTPYNMHIAGDAGTNYVGLGPEVGANNYVYTGSVDEIALFNRMLSDAEIATLYESIVTRNVTSTISSVTSVTSPNLSFPSTNVSSTISNVTSVTSPNLSFEKKNVSSTISAGTTISGSTTIGGAISTGGTLTTSGSYLIHTFTSTGSFTTNYSSIDTTILIVGNGGRGGSGVSAGVGGGGGAGGVLVITGSLNSGSYTVSVVNGNSYPASFANYTASGGGEGGYFNGVSVVNGADGGCGGGGGTNGFGGNGIVGQGYDGGDSSAGAAGAGGGGAGGAGQNSSGATAGVGGIGRSVFISGSAITYSVGGEGGETSTQGATGTTPGCGGGGGKDGSLGTNGVKGIVIVKIKPSSIKHVNSSIDIITQTDAELTPENVVYTTSTISTQTDVSSTNQIYRPLSSDITIQTNVTGNLTEDNVATTSTISIVTDVSASTLSFGTKNVSSTINVSTDITGDIKRVISVSSSINAQTTVNSGIVQVSGRSSDINIVTEVNGVVVTTGLTTSTIGIVTDVSGNLGYASKEVTSTISIVTTTSADLPMINRRNSTIYINTEVDSSLALIYGASAPFDTQVINFIVENDNVDFIVENDYIQYII